MVEIKNSPLPQSISLEILPYEEGTFLIGLNNNETENIGNRIENFYQKINKEKNQHIDRNPTTMIKGAIFAIGSRKLNNFEWKEHCSSSLREIFHVWRSGRLNGLQNDYRDYYKGSREDINDKLKDLWNYYEFFSGIDHHEHEKWRYALQGIKKQTTKHTTGLSDEEFTDLLKGFFSLLKEVFS